jgi:hypothetical protein
VQRVRPSAVVVARPHSLEEYADMKARTRYADDRGHVRSPFADRNRTPLPVGVRPGYVRQ